MRIPLQIVLIHVPISIASYFRHQIKRAGAVIDSDWPSPESIQSPASRSGDCDELPHRGWVARANSGVLANHTLEMIPKSMILITQLNTCPPPISDRVSAIEMGNECKPISVGYR